MAQAAALRGDLDASAAAWRAPAPPPDRTPYHVSTPRHARFTTLHEIIGRLHKCNHFFNKIWVQDGAAARWLGEPWELLPPPPPEWEKPAI